MNSKTLAAPHGRGFAARVSTALTLALTAAGMAVLPTPAHAIGVAVPLGTAASFAVLAGQSVTNTGPSTITGDVGVSPGTSVTGFPPGTVNGVIHAADAVALQAQTDLTVAYNNAAGQASDASVSGDLGGRTLNPGVYTASSSIGLTGSLTLDAHGDPNAVWIFQVGSTLTTASASRVLLVNGAAPCNVFWKIGSSATIGTNSTFVGNILALTSISATTGATIDGRALARNGSVTLDTNTITRETCSTGGTTSGTTSGTTAGTTAGTSGGTTGGTTSGTTAGTTGGTTSGTTSGTTAGTTAGTTGGATGGTTAGTTGGAASGGGSGGRPPVGGVGTGVGGAAQGPSATEITIGGILVGLSLTGIGFLVVRRRALTGS
ncbi:hypothetical protein P3T37_005640 [Kitasatospora sp. MAA4]|uniref:ice-binding family protein n=1 Tax=Kitasatospora sp. MAA4 TaxID=3035093 RepID=UPI00247721EE|nr:ice-binding family protein [Kitasatospora sp. MAA4]MDH6136221.1 hypothetical protein [Kitasatospora sp. MAA4]